MNDDSDGDSIEDNNSSSDYDDDSSVSGKSFYHPLAMVHVAREPILIHHSNQVVAERRKVDKIRSKYTPKHTIL